MSFYVYIIQSQLDNSFYKGYSEDPYKRLLQHNNGESVYTCHKTPWILVYIENCLGKKRAIIREKNLKKATKERIYALIDSSKNILNKK